MSCGLSVLSTKSGGPESIIANDTLGILCEHEELEKGLMEITKKKFDSKLIRDYVLDHFSAIAKDIDITLYDTQNLNSFSIRNIHI